MKPLYLRGAEPLLVSLDGPALKVSTETAADRRYPLERISRVVVSNRVSWSTEALLACADEGITVCFLRGDGAVRARWTGPASKRGELPQCWHDFVDRPDWEAQFMQWRSALRRRAIRFCAMRLGWSPHRDLADLARAVLNSTDGCASGFPIRVFRKRLHSLARAFAVAELTKHGLSTDEYAEVQLIPVLATSIQWGLHPELTRWCHDQAGDCMRHGKPIHDVETAVMLFFEKHTDSATFHVRDTLLHLGRFMASLR